MNDETQEKLDWIIYYIKLREKRKSAYSDFKSKVTLGKVDNIGVSFQPLIDIDKQINEHLEARK